MSTELRIKQIQDELHTLANKRKQLLTELRKLQSEELPKKTYGRPLENVDPSIPDGKIKIFLNLFRCREDVWSSPKKLELIKEIG